MTISDLSSVLDKVRKLLNLADDERTPANEAASARARAESIIQKYRIEEQDLINSRPDLGLKPISVQIDLIPVSTQYRNTYYYLIHWISEHCGVRVGGLTQKFSEIPQMWTVELVGYHSDIQYAELLYASARAVFSSRMEPAVDRSLSDEDNVYRLRSAGIERARIAELLWGIRDSKPANIKVTKLYKRACEARGENPDVSGRRISAKTFRREYSDQFVATLYYRLRQARDATDTDAGALVLASRKDQVDEAYYQRYPYLRPEETDDKATSKPRKRSERERLAAYRRAQAREANPAVQAGRQAGQAAAREVPLDGAKRTRRLEAEKHEA